MNHRINPQLKAISMFQEKSLADFTR